MPTEDRVEELEGLLEIARAEIDERKHREAAQDARIARLLAQKESAERGFQIDYDALSARINEITDKQRRTEDEIEQIVGQANQAITDLDTKYVDALRHARFLAQALVTIMTYSGNDLMVPQDLAAVALRDNVLREGGDDDLTA